MPQAASRKPLVSVIIVNYNAGDLLTKCVKSVINFDGVEVVVADNASRDDSFVNLGKKIQSSRLILIDNHANLGFGKAVNLAVKQSHGDYIYLLNPDAELSSAALKRMVETAKKYQDRAIVAPRLENPDGTPQSSCYRPQTILNAIKEFWFGMSGSYSKYLPTGQKPQVVYAAVAAAWLVPRNVWNELSGLSPRFFLYFEDIDLCDRANRAGIPIIYDPLAVVRHVHGVSSRTNPIVLKLFTDSAWEYHGKVKKIIIDGIIHLRDFFTPPLSHKKLLCIFVLYSLFVFGVATAGYFLLPSRFSPTPLIDNFYHRNFLLWSWANFDGAHYLGIAQQGYHVVAGQSQYAFFPLLPVLINFLTRIGFDAYLAGHLIVLVSFVGFMFVLVKWAAQYVKNPLSILWLILLSPGTVFLMSIYTEPVFLFLAILTFYFADKKQWGRAVLSTALATATRVNGIFLVLFLVIKLIKNKIPYLRSTIYVLPSLTGLFAFMYYLWQKSGDPFAWYHAHGDWEKATATAPWVTFSSYLQAITIDFIPDLTHLVVIIEVVTTLILLYLLIVFLRQRKLGNEYKAYAIGNLALPLITGSLGSMPRFSLTLFPLFLLIPSLSPRTRLITVSCFLIPAIIGIVLFTRGYWYA